ncbi:acetate--CoA ligase family protein [Rhodococcus pseudokoreensis]|uniref:Acetate--CoA ligase family protein n=1 Tax=Rhodococcus pseudokoreensis TaxID=2811421 RepID=A0A974ZWM3_9NOCA|nr:acetate--CoA ligase family protein [Rhodococcus pseudokoreensis]QSE92771.1 acetate--CoA ligase family protein [Rhodococcus pseudokoreensis]
MTQTNGRDVFCRDDLEKLINPTVIAVVGASATPGGFGKRTMENLSGFTGRVYGVNPRYDTVEGRPCVPTLHDLPEVPDCVIVCVAQHLVLQTLEDAAHIGARGAIVYASGFSETGGHEGIAAQEAIAELAARTGLRVAGPNCVGLINVATGGAMNFMTDSGSIIDGAAGGIAIVSQSGALGYTILQAVQRGVGVSHYLASGNSADVDVCDYIAYLADEPTAKVIICMMEGVKSGKRFLQAARRADAAGKPLIVYKAGNGEKSGLAAMSHTGTLTGSTAAYEAACEHAGAIWVDDLEALTEIASFFAKNPAGPSAPGVGIMSTSGGAGVINADKAEDNDLDLPPLHASTREALTQVVPAFGSIGNPADLTAEVLKDAATFSHCLDAFTADPGLGAVVVPLVFVHESTTGVRAPLLSEAGARTETAIAAVWMNEWLEGPGSRMLDSDPKITLFRSAARCMRTIRLWQDWHARRRSIDSDRPAERISDPRAATTAREILAAAADTGSSAVTEQQAKAVLSAYGIAVPQEAVTTTAEEAAAFADRFGYPVVLKIASPDIQHKTEIGGVRLNLGSAEEVRVAATEILDNTRILEPTARIDGVSVQTMIGAGAEVLLGAQIDPQFGPMITVGSGGIFVELLRDVTTQLTPVTAVTARRAIESLRLHKILTGLRGDPGYDIDALVDAVTRFSEMVDDLADILTEVDVNPLIVGRTGAIAADALVALHHTAAVTV